MAGPDGGIENKIHPGEAATKDLYHLPPEEDALVPTVCQPRPGPGIPRQGPAFPDQGGVFTTDVLDAYIDLKMTEATRFRMAPHPVEFEHAYFAVKSPWWLGVPASCPAEGEQESSKGPGAVLLSSAWVVRTASAVLFLCRGTAGRACRRIARNARLDAFPRPDHHEDLPPHRLALFASLVGLSAPAQERVWRAAATSTRTTPLMRNAAAAS